jgi:hypothetical protein
MRKIFFFIPVLFFSCFFLSCDPENSNTKNTVSDIQYLKSDYTLYELGRLEGLDEDTEWQILQAYLKKLQSGGENADLTINDVWVEKYFGVYCPLYRWWRNDDVNLDWYTFAAKNQTVFAVMLGSKGKDRDNEQQEIDIRHFYGRAFVKDGDRIFLWHNGQLYSLAEHYFNLLGDGFNPNPLLSVSDFLEIANMQNGLDIETLRRIQVDWGESVRLPDSPIRRYYDYPIQYLGTYNGYIVVIVYCGVNTSVFHMEIDGVHFYNSSSGHYIIAWKEGGIYTLQDLYERKLISHEDLVNMAYNLNGSHREEKK